MHIARVGERLPRLQIQFRISRSFRPRNLAKLGSKIRFWIRRKEHPVHPKMHASRFTKFKLIVRDARVFPGIWFDFIYPHNSSLFFATPQIYVAADKNKIYSPVLL